MDFVLSEKWRLRRETGLPDFVPSGSSTLTWLRSVKDNAGPMVEGIFRSM